MESRAQRGTCGRRVLGILAVASLGAAASAATRDLDFEQRVAAQRAIEEVYWRHRIWPADNPGPKPALSDVLSEAVLRARVENYLAQSNALETWWGRPIEAVELQAELDRMARQTRAPARLAELRAALGDDAFVIAETLARATLADRLIRNRYAADERFHGDLRRAAQQALERAPAVSEMRELGGRYAEKTFSRSPGSRAHGGDLRPELVLDGAQWEALWIDLARQFGTAPDAIPLRRVSPLNEDAERFWVSAVLARGRDEAVVTSVEWPKRSYAAWWSEERLRTSTILRPPDAGYRLAALDVGCVDDTWTLSYYAPGARSNHTAVWTGAEMIVWGGTNAIAALNTGGRYDPATDRWSPTSQAGHVPASRVSHSAIWTGTEMIVWGGQSTSTALNTGGRYDPASDTWAPTSTGPSAPAGRYGHAAVWTGTTMIVWGGVAPAYLNSGGRYTPANDTWAATSTGANVPAGRRFHTAVWTGARMIVWGGFNGAYLSTGGLYDPTADTWVTTSTGTNVPSARRFHTAVWTGSAMIVWGGFNGAYLSTGALYDAAMDTWNPTAGGANLPATRIFHTAVWTGSEMIVWGGRDAVGPLDTGGRYVPSTGLWTPTATSNAPLPRDGHTAVWTGLEMIVWGGNSFAGPGHTGGRYVPSTDGWIATSTGADVPAPRFDHTAVWTGSEMIVWGGNTNTGGRYDPATDAWQATPTGQDVPAPRSLHSAVWTGEEMIVWGGGAGAPVNTGGRYDPTSNTWLPTSTGSGVPSPRAGHVAVWTGTEMIVWGNSNPPSGARYAPATDGWTPARSDTAPLAHNNQVGVWTGSEMIVWGGLQGSVPQNQGGRYSPSTDTWLPTSTGSGVPSPRTANRAVWTGTEMIVWGGFVGDVFGTMYYDTGGRYAPSTDSWTATPTTSGVPAPRGAASVVWTGTEMIVWGGVNTALLNTGGRYTVSTNTWSPTSIESDTPAPRSAHAAVWTGTRMLVWGGSSFDANLGLYCGSECLAVAPPAGVPALGGSKAGAALVLSWPPIAGADGYDVVRGSLFALRQSGGDFSGATTRCVADDRAAPGVNDVEAPAPGNGFWYLVRAVNCAGAGSFDAGSPGQVAGRDAEIEASGVACP